MTKLPIPIDELDQAFGTRAMDILPKYSEIPEEFLRDSHPWVAWQRGWFFKGLKKYPKPKEGIDRDLAMANLACCQHSFEPKHEHKMAGVAYLASLWFESPDGDEVPA
jgi:hypothetical protein